MADEKETQKPEVKEAMTPVFAMEDIPGFKAKAGDIFEMPTKFVTDAVRAKKVRGLSPREKEARGKKASA